MPPFGQLVQEERDISGQWSRFRTSGSAMKQGEFGVDSSLRRGISSLEPGAHGVPARERRRVETPKWGAQLEIEDRSHVINTNSFLSSARRLSLRDGPLLCGIKLSGTVGDKASSRKVFLGADEQDILLHILNTDINRGEITAQCKNEWKRYATRFVLLVMTTWATEWKGFGIVGQIGRRVGFSLASSLPLWDRV
ncbi:hypothetical protein N431DRAFT_562524 [Stipitochalara longipes BDJ]|nr:hypothetical protein N431DRAFT_562524 [Stipitochalara longipes BDJ]